MWLRIGSESKANRTDYQFMTLRPKRSHRAPGVRSIIEDSDDEMAALV
jgi:hypothetical protein